MTNYFNYHQALNQFPVVSLSHFAAENNLQGSLLACLAYSGSTGTIKTPLAYGMISIAKERKLLSDNQTIVEASSGAFGAALALVAHQMGHHVILCVSATTPRERIDLLKSLGAEVIPCPLAQSQWELSKHAAQIAEQKHAYFMDCFSNDINPEFHRRVTGPAILRATDSDLDFIVAGVGTGGTITGVGEYAKAWSNISMIAVEPYESQVLNGGFAGSHSIAGIGIGFVPNNYNPYVVNRIMSVSGKDAAYAAQQVLLTEGIPVCRSGGATVEAACHILKEKPNSKVLCIFSGIELLTNN